MNTSRHAGGPPAPGKPVRTYDTTFKADDAYRASLPDMQNADSSGILGANVPIIRVGMSNFRLPLTFLTKSGGTRSLEASVTGTVSLVAGRKGINMSRIMRVFYEFGDRAFTPGVIEEILRRYRNDLDSTSASLSVEFNYPMRLTSLRSGIEGWQYYRCVYEGVIDAAGRARRRIHFDFVYSSACPCSGELSEHARGSRNVFAIPHSQRSKARVVAEIAAGAELAVEDLREHCLAALRTETQVMVKREDEQAFAELNGAHMKFVEDAVRLVYAELDADPRIADFRVVCAHLESLHSHDAVAVVNKGVPGGLDAEFGDFKALIC